ncbi:uncharacterized protein VTP21DRAFT_2370 [Calcarisporiella thermophila]|uniref:uncharacterized protein n=1 Tax=Calcarisporiella thermophila TaxID=911321 RepID=UPI0037422C12
MNYWKELNINPQLQAKLDKRGKVYDPPSDLLFESPIVTQQMLCISPFDVNTLQHAASNLLVPQKFTAHELLNTEKMLTTGDSQLDQVLGGGVVVGGGITELFGESGTGKTQFCMQLCLTVQLPEENGGLDGEAIYMACETKLPLRLLHRLLPTFRTRFPSLPINASSRIHFHILPDVDTQLHILRYHLPAFLEQRRGRVRLIVVDSIAANFRAEWEDMRAKTESIAGKIGSKKEKGNIGKIEAGFDKNHELCEMAIMLKQIASQGVAVVCVNEVSTRISTETMFTDELAGYYGNRNKRFNPALGLVWSNAVNTRIRLSRVRKTNDNSSRSEKRWLNVEFASHAPANIQSAFHIREDGLYSA